MSNQNIFSMIQAKVKGYQQNYELDNLTSAFTWLVLQTLHNLSDLEIDDAITDSSDDGGIDAVYISGQDVHLFTTTYTDKFELTRKNFPGSDLEKMASTVDSIMGKTLKEKHVNSLVWEKYLEINELIQDGPINLKFYICSNKERPAQHECDKFETRLSKYHFVEYHYVDQDALANFIIENKSKKINGSLTFISDQHFHRSDVLIRGTIATVLANDLVDLITDKSTGKVNEDVFNENVRVYKPKNRVNKKMLQSAMSDDNFQFWYLNNGITIVCDDLKYNPNANSPRAKLTNFKIVNGSQTSHTLFNACAKDKEKTKNIELLVRIYVTDRSNPISSRISETTNSQIPVSSRDLHSNDDIQLRLQEEFSAFGYYYETKPGQFDKYPKDRILSNELLAQLYLAYYLDMPSQAKNQKSIIWGEKYDDIFEEDAISATRMLLPYKIYIPLNLMKRQISLKKRKKEAINEEEAFVSRATLHVLNAVKLISEIEKIDLKLDENINSAIKKSIDMIGEVVKKEIKQRKKLYTHDKFFKEEKTNEIIRQYVLENLK